MPTAMVFLPAWGCNGIRISAVSILFKTLPQLIMRGHHSPFLSSVCQIPNDVAIKIHKKINTKQKIHER